MSKELFNARQQLAAIAEWLGYQHEELSFGLRSSYDAMRLYDYAQQHGDFPELADDWSAEQRIAALGYDPLETWEAVHGRSVVATGAEQAHRALQTAYTALDSVAFLSVEGDTVKVLEQIAQVIHPSVKLLSE